MSNKNINKIVKKVLGVLELDITSAFQMFMNYKKEAEITTREIKRVDAAKEVLLTEKYL